MPTAVVYPCIRSADSETVDKVDPARLGIAFHSEWMERAPDTVLAHGVLDRRKRFPVAAVVVVNEDISILRSSLEEVAVVVEHIVSENRYSMSGRRMIVWLNSRHGVLQIAAVITVASLIFTSVALDFDLFAEPGIVRPRKYAFLSTCRRQGLQPRHMC